MEPLHLKVGNGFQVTRYILPKNKLQVTFSRTLASSLIFDRLLPSHKSPIVILQLQVTVTILLVRKSNGVTVPLCN
jgi:hypothetical protein